MEKGTSRSTAKLKPLHGAIANDLAERLGPSYDIWAQGYLHDKESKMEGRYYNKRVDITIKRDGKPVAGIGVKFVMQNYSQNSNNYFENMLGETANIRCAQLPYFQIFVILDYLPHYNREKRITKWETITDHNMSKYITLSADDVNQFFHTPNKTLVYVVHLPNATTQINTHSEYIDYYQRHRHDLTLSQHDFGSFQSAVIVNDYERFARKVFHTILAL